MHMNVLRDARRRFGCLVMASALFLSIGGHLALLQGVAWATMIRDYSRTSSVTAAVEKTFDGRHPCAMCKKIAAQRSHDEKVPVTVKVQKKSEVFLREIGSKLPLPTFHPFVYGPTSFFLMPELCFAPPVPVPISHLA